MKELAQLILAIAIILIIAIAFLHTNNPITQAIGEVLYAYANLIIIVIFSFIITGIIILAKSHAS